MEECGVVKGEGEAGVVICICRRCEMIPIVAVVIGI